MSSTVFYKGKYRFFFFSREESRKHVHVTCSEGEAEFWLEPDIALATTYHLPDSELNILKKLVEEHQIEIIQCWNEHFDS